MGYDQLISFQKDVRLDVHKTIVQRIEQGMLMKVIVMGEGILEGGRLCFAVNLGSCNQEEDQQSEVAGTRR